MALRPSVSAMLRAVVMTAIYPQFVDERKTTIGGLAINRPYAMYCGMKESAEQYHQVGVRLRSIREGFSDLNQKDWAERHNFSVTQYNNWERGVRRIPVDDAERLCSTYGVSLDFIYRGRRDGLSERASKVV